MQLHANNIKHLENMDKFLKKDSPQRLNQEEVEIMNRLITSTEIKIVIKNLPTNKSPGLDGFTNSIKLYQTFREQLISILLKLVQKTVEGGTLPNPFDEATITLIPKADKDYLTHTHTHTHTQNYRPIPLMNIDAKIFKIYQQSKSSNTLKGS